MAEVPLVSVVIPAFNRAGLITEAVNSVLEQDWRPLEIVIVDDGSSDGTAAVAEQLAREHSGVAKLVRRPNGGPGAARQSGVEASRGIFVQFLDSDDLLLPGKIRAQVEALLSDHAAGIAYGRTVLEHDGIRRHCPELWSGEPTRQLFPGLLLRRYWDTSNPLYRRSALEQIGPWVPRRQLEDWEYDCRAAALRIPVHYCDIDVDVHRSHAVDRLHGVWLSNDEALRDRLWAYQRVCDHALAAGVDTRCREFRAFVRSLFLMARTAGTRELSEEAEIVFAQVRRLAVERGWQIRAFALLRSILGWRNAVKMAERFRLSIAC